MFQQSNLFQNNAQIFSRNLAEFRLMLNNGLPIDDVIINVGSVNTFQSAEIRLNLICSL